jgi:hypothetical protein
VDRGLALVGASASVTQASPQNLHYRMIHIGPFADEAPCNTSRNYDTPNFPEIWDGPCVYFEQGVEAIPPQPGDTRPGWYYIRHASID